MTTIHQLLGTPAHQPRGGRQHRFMESADVGAAFSAVFMPLRSNIRRGLSIHGQIYGLEADPCIPGELLGASWLPPASFGVSTHDELLSPDRRRTLFQRLLAEPRPEALFAYVCERTGPLGPALYVEIASADGTYVAEFPICQGGGWHVRDLVLTPHRRLSAP